MLKDFAAALESAAGEGATADSAGVERGQKLLSALSQALDSVTSSDSTNTSGSAGGTSSSDSVLKQLAIALDSSNQHERAVAQDLLGRGRVGMEGGEGDVTLGAPGVGAGQLANSSAEFADLQTLRWLAEQSPTAEGAELWHEVGRRASFRLRYRVPRSGGWHGSSVCKKGAAARSAAHTRPIDDSHCRRPLAVAIVETALT